MLHICSTLNPFKAWFLTVFFSYFMSGQELRVKNKLSPMTTPPPKKKKMLSPFLFAISQEKEADDKKGIILQKRAVRDFPLT